MRPALEEIGFELSVLDHRSPKLLLLAWVLLAVTVTNPHRAMAWGDEGHRIIALVAEHYLDPGARAKIASLLAADTDTLTGHDIASEAIHRAASVIMC